MANKNAFCPMDGLNQKFKITNDKNGRKGVSVSSKNEISLEMIFLAKPMYWLRLKSARMIEEHGKPV